MVDRNGERRLKRRGVVLHHLRQVEAAARIRQERNARLTATVFQHKVDVFRRRFFGGANEIAFVFTVFVVHNDNDFAFFERFDRFFDRIESTGHNASFQTRGPDGNGSVALRFEKRRASEKFYPYYYSA